MSAYASAEPPDLKRRALLVRATAAVGGAAVAGAATPFIASLQPSARATAHAAPVQFDPSHLQPEGIATVQWRSRPIWVVRRTEAQLRTLTRVTAELSDPQSKVSQQPPDMTLHLAEGLRAVQPQLLVLVGLCTHLGCIPRYYPEQGSLGPGWPGGFYCPCHGSKYDMSGRVFSGSPAPLNLPVPPYYLASAEVITIGETRSGGDRDWQPSIW
jgi:ubiquinol-cytochrome c reductase iron-sulfur subunit